MPKLLHKKQAGLYTARHGVRAFELRHEKPGTRNRSWWLYEVSTPEHEVPRGDRVLDMLIKSIKDGEKALEFILAVYDHVEGLGAVEGDHHAWVLETRLGPLTINPGATHVFMRFTDVERARVELGDKLYNTNHFNPYSGKWNMHWGAGIDNETMLRDFRRQISRVVSSIE